MKKIFLLMSLAILASLTFVSAQTYSCPMGNSGLVGGMMYGSYGSGWLIFTWILGILMLVALILLIFWLFKQINKKR